MDGYAVRAEDFAQASAQRPVSLPVAADIPAGSPADAPLAPQSVHRIMTGACLPPGADAILPFESTDRGAQVVRAHAPTTPGAHIRRAGEDLEKGGLALPAGTRLGSAQIGLIAALGLPEVAVFAPARVLILSTGSELTEPGLPLAPGRIYESNSPMLAAAARETGAVAHRLRSTTDDVVEFRDRIDQAIDELDQVDLIITSGGVSAGEFEVVKQAFAGVGPLSPSPASGRSPQGGDEVEFVSVAMQPGKPQGAGWFRPRSGASPIPVVTLPGNPVSAQISFEVFLRAPLLAAMGHRRPERRRVVAKLSDPVRSPVGKRQFLRGILAEDKASVAPFGPPGSHFLRSMALSNCLIDVPAELAVLAAGDEVVVWDLS
jgi:molybdopterin molybdotransferase